MIGTVPPDVLSEVIDDPDVRKYITERERRIRAESNLEAAGALQELAMEIDELIAKKEDGESLGSC
jgi:hypothetical protein